MKFMRTALSFLFAPVAVAIDSGVASELAGALSLCRIGKSFVWPRHAENHPRGCHFLPASTANL